MKFKFLLIYLHFFGFSSIIAQESGNFYPYVRHMDDYYNAMNQTTPDSLKIPGKKDYQRWRDFWMNRVHNSTEIKGDMDLYGARMMEALGNPAYLTDQFGDWTWQFVGPQNVSTHNKGIISSLYINPDDINEIYTGSNSSGLFRTLDGGLNWECVTDNLDLPAMGINDIAVNPLNKQIKYIAINPLYRSGPAFIYKTNDDCKSWQRVFNPPANKRTAIRVVLNPYNPSIVYATIQDAVYRSSDDGKSWDLIFDSLTYDPSWYLDRKLLVEIEFKPGDPKTLIIGSTGIRNRISHDASAEIWMTHDAESGFVSWQRISGGLPEYCDRYALTTHPLDSSFLLIGYSVGVGSYRAQFNVEKLNLESHTIEHVFDKEWWQNYNSPFSGMGYWCNGMELSPVNPDILFVGGYSLQVLDLKTKQYCFFKFDLREKESHVDQRIFKVVRANGKTYLFAGNDGGITRFEYETGTLKSCNGNGLNNVQYYGIGHSEKTPDFVIGGTQDNGVFGNGSGNWDVTAVGDAYEVIVDPEEPENVYITATGGTKFIARSVNHGKSFFNTPQPLVSGGLNDRPFLMSPTDRKTLYVGYDELYKTEDQCLSWKQISDFQNPNFNWNCGDAISDIGLSETDPNTLYAAFINPTWGTQSARLFKTSDGGISWDNLTQHLAGVLFDKGITGITVSPFDADKVWVSFNGYANDGLGNAIKKVLYSVDGGYTWTDISSSLPDLPVNIITRIKNESQFKIMIGNDLGIFLFDEDANSWKNISNGLPKTIVSDIEVNYSSKELIAGTFGRGIWKCMIPAGIDKRTDQDKNKLILSRFSVNPNPTTNTISFKLPEGIIIQQARLQIIDGQGHVIMESIPMTEQNVLDISNLVNGLYLLRLFDGKNITTARFLKT